MLPYLIRGALGVGAKRINRNLEIATVCAMADLARQAPDFGPDHLITSPFELGLLEKALFRLFGWGLYLVAASSVIKIVRSVLTARMLMFGVLQARSSESGS